MHNSESRIKPLTNKEIYDIVNWRGSLGFFFMPKKTGIWHIPVSKH